MQRRIAYSAIGLSILFSARGVGGVDWCSLKCRDGSQNTMCKYKPVSRVGNCTDIRESTTPTIRREMLEMHNNYRNALAGGKMNGWPKAADMRYMTWDGYLEQVGLRWAMQCISDHDKCRRTEDFEFVGQNFAMIGNSGFFPSSNISFRAWVDEIRLATSALVTSFLDGKWGHFSQVGWANSSKLGCGEVRYLESDMKKTTIVCNYGPAGNIETLGMYAAGEPCSKCPPGTSCQPDSVYPNLCSVPQNAIPRTMADSNREASKVSENLSNVAPAHGGTPASQTPEWVTFKILVAFITVLLNGYTRK